MIANESTQINIRVAPNLLEELDSIIKVRNYKNRQEFIREAIREKMSKESQAREVEA